jgi:tRNA A-37 threonylcarbamoyl transferase component Bud32/tetratricopeptide (TPR) repeat protein
MSDSTNGWMAALASHYVVDEKIGEGATAEVWSAARVGTGERVAIKVLRREVALEIGTQRFLREIAVAGSISHPAIVPVLESGEADGVPYQVMPLIPGETLRSRLDRERQLPLETVLAIAGQVAEALDAAHAAGVVHRDIKPENIVVDGDRAFVLDFGIAYAIDAAVGDRITASGLTVGTPQYMSPEQAAAERRLDGRSDIYSLACVVFEMLAGQPPFTGATTQAIRARHVSEAAPSIRVVRPSLPPSVEEALRVGLAKSPADRPGTAGEFAALLRRASPKAQRAPRLLLIAAMLLVVAGAGWWWRANSQRAAPAGPNWILVGDLAAPPEDRRLAQVIRDLTVSALGQSQRFSLVPSEQVATARRIAGVPDSTALTLEQAREIAVRSSVRVVVGGSLKRLGEHDYALTIMAVNADNGALLVSRSIAARDTGATIVREVGAAVQQLRAELGEMPAAIASTRPLQNVATPSFDAYRLYQDALARFRVGDNEGAAHLLRRALSYDSAFASAWYLLATSHINAHRADSARAYYARALAVSDRLDPADVDRLRADFALNVEHDPPAALHWFDRYLAQRPHSFAAHNNRAGALSAMGRHEDALRGLEAAMRVGPLVVGPRQIELLNVTLELAALGRLDSARVVARRLGEPHAGFARMVLLTLASHWDSLASEAGRLATDPATPRLSRFPATTAEIGARAALGDTAQVRALFERAMRASQGQDLRWFTSARLLHDRSDGAATRWPLPQGIRRDASVEAAFVRGLYAAQAHDAASLSNAIAAIEGRDSIALRRIGAGLALLRSLRHVERGEPARAVALLDLLARAGEHQPYTLDRANSYWIRWVAAEALYASGRRLDAIVMLDTLLAAAGAPPNHVPLRGLLIRQGAERKRVWTAEGK